MHADERTRTVVHREWTLPTPAHHTEVAKVVAVAHQKHDAEPGHPTDVAFTHGDDEIVIGYSVERHPALVAGVADHILRTERDAMAERLSLAYQAVTKDGYFGPYPLGDDLASQITELLVHLRGRAESAEAAIVRARQLATEWSATTGVEAAEWRGPAMLLHEALDGPRADPGDGEPE